MSKLTPRYLRQPPEINRFTNPLWERACSRRRQVSELMARLTQRFREQARSHRDLRQPPEINRFTNPLWE
ncbi:hypothetical protein EVS84_11930 [Pseudomonas koreensis]|uniref:Uncharacterized protein n=1 Tax=Pseudomonas koreensis TaxID=198620 RepID=A0A4V1WHR3_9PSED|nr:hypothetical protein EVS84_11930 [Pseudomonas koreensis]